MLVEKSAHALHLNNHSYSNKMKQENDKRLSIAVNIQP